MIINDLQIQITTGDNEEILDKFFDGYNKAFVLPNEKEDEDEFRVWLNNNDYLINLYGNFKEVIFVAFDETNFVGGVSFIAFPSSNLLTINQNYLYIDEDQRGKSYLKRMSDAIPIIARKLFDLPNNFPTMSFLEQNNPFKMSSDDYERDTKETGIDQIQRIQMWAKLGTKIINFPYVQPALSQNKEPDYSLIYSVIGINSKTLDAIILRDHLQRFFGLSILKGKPIELDPIANHQLQLLTKRKQIRLTDPLIWLERNSSPK